jgi:DNA ligase D-like protein (predicted 3'-phosphoesterase)
VPEAQPLQFVVQEHFARTHHFDLRLEREGVFKSWALPKGFPTEVGEKRLALEVSDHDLAFGDFEGEIPPGEYGAGRISIWDRGEYQQIEWSEDRIVFIVQAKRIIGDYLLMRFPRGGRSAWLIIRQL